MSDPTPGLHPAQNRALRELYAGTRQLAGHWEALADRLAAGEGVEDLRAGAAAAEELVLELAEVTEGYGLYGFPAASGVGARMAGLRNAVTDRTLERNQALRTAVLDVQHVVTLCGYLAALAQARDDEPLAEFCGRWERKLKRLEGRVRRAAIASGADPDAAVEPVDHGALGRAGHRLAEAGGTLGEWVDRRAARRRRHT
ncbi:MAG TPA: hypothetical protein VNB64_01165 [Solirubrobacteraceae bacterium]|nr:hypothetical protein [Solirubrobacteraceae bacterium]